MVVDSILKTALFVPMDMSRLGQSAKKVASVTNSLKAVKRGAFHATLIAPLVLPTTIAKAAKTLL